MYKIYNKQTGEFLGRFNEAQLDFLREHLEEESLNDQDYYLRKETVDDFEQRNPPPGLIDNLRGALRGNSSVEIRWEKE